MSSATSLPSIWLLRSRCRTSYVFLLSGLASCHGLPRQFGILTPSASPPGNGGVGVPPYKEEGIQEQVRAGRESILGRQEEGEQQSEAEGLKDGEVEEKNGDGME